MLTVSLLKDTNTGERHTYFCQPCGTVRAGNTHSVVGGVWKANNTWRAWVQGQPRRKNKITYPSRFDAVMAVALEARK